ncbi:MAG: DsrE/DsrF/DrsH-like family protein [Chloroflexi bacterium]|nr:DsrE/DsrF/DrsH-like family protein [Chloroflexota bacterium]
MEGDKKQSRVAIILHSGAYDRVSYALAIARAALAMGMEVHLLATFSGLMRFVKGHTEDLGDDMPPDLQSVISRGLSRGSFPPITESIQEAKRLGLKVYACSAAMGHLNITIGDLTEEVDTVMGLVYFLELAENAAINLYV